MDDSFLAVLFGSYQCTFADPCHGGDLAIGLALIQKRQRQGNLFRRELLHGEKNHFSILALRTP